MDPTGRSALVTGGVGGLGSATVRHLAAAGWAVVVLDRDAELAASQVAALPVPGVAVTGDAVDDDAVATAVEAAGRLGELTVVVNAAGGGVGGGPTVRRDGTPHDSAGFASTLATNALATFNVCRLAAAAMRLNSPGPDGDRGVIVNTASVAGFEGQRGQVAYAAAKASILGMTLPMARDLAPVGIRVCALAPGPMATPAMLRLRDRLDEDPAADVVFPARMGEPDEFAAAVGMVVENPYLNGVNLRLDGALRLG